MGLGQIVAPVLLQLAKHLLHNLFSTALKDCLIHRAEKPDDVPVDGLVLSKEERMEISRVAGETLEKARNLWLTVALEYFIANFPLLSSEAGSTTVVWNSFGQTDAVQSLCYGDRPLLSILFTLNTHPNSKRQLLMVSAIHCVF